jgi:hypothetical protein
MMCWFVWVFFFIYPPVVMLIYKLRGQTQVRVSFLLE